MNVLMKAVREALDKTGLWKDGTVLLCALSGGCDSVALLHALCHLRKQKAIRVHAVHVQHGLRGEDSLADERFVRDLCQSLMVPLAVENACLSGDMHTPGMETLARERRRAIFEAEMRNLQADALLTAHHQDDQAETVLMHLLRGSGMNGLCGMRMAAPFGGALVVRPFLNLPKQHLRNALDTENLPFREDGSNQEPVTPRNILRLSLLPQLEMLFPAAGAHMAHTADMLAADEAYLQGEADRLYQAICYQSPPLFMLRLEPLLAAPQAIRIRVLRRWFASGLAAADEHPQERALSYEDTLALSALPDEPAGTRLNLPCGLMAARETGWLHLVHQNGEPLQKQPPYSIPINASHAQYVLPHLTLHAEPASHLPDNPRSILLTREWLDRSPVLRLPKPEDVVHPFGAPGRKPLRRYLTDRKIDPFLRHCWPVLCVQNEILWIPGLCAAEMLRLSHMPTDGIQLILSGDTPFPLKPPKE